MCIEFKDLPRWQFEVEEVSVGIYKVSGKDKSDRNIELKGAEPDALLEKCKEYALQFVKDQTTKI
jgi:hypothetical protein